MLCLFLTQQTNGKFEEWRKFLKENDMVKIKQNHKHGEQPVFARWMDASNKNGGNKSPVKKVEMINPIKLLEVVDSSLPENKTLNRYRNILACDHTIVKLPEDRYINANLITLNGY